MAVRVDQDASIARPLCVDLDGTLVQSDMLVEGVFAAAASASVAATVVLALFIQSEGTAERYRSPALLWGIVPLVLFWQFRIWLSTARGYMQDDPIVYAARDRVSWATALAALLLMAAARVLHVG